MQEEKLWGWDDESILYSDWDNDIWGERIQDHPELFARMVIMVRQHFADMPQSERDAIQKPPEHLRKGRK